jgi:SAM-dependent methyltransferase
VTEPAADPGPPSCRICHAPSVAAGQRHSDFSQRDFDLAHCPSCGFSFVVCPRTDFEKIYDEAYYAGRGADPHVAYTAGAEGVSSVQEYEWRGIIEILRENAGLTPSSRWLDFGCGLGGLVRYARAGGYQPVGHDEGYAAEQLPQLDTPSLSSAELDGLEGTFDIVTAIEVIEHVIEPVQVLSRIGRLLRPGGVLFLTTGNAEPYRGRIDRWQYVRPDIHVSFFEPETLRMAYRRAGLEPWDVPFGRGHAELVRSKVLRTVNVHKPNVIERAVPWSIASRLIDRRFGVTKQPLARREPTAAQTRPD